MSAAIIEVRKETPVALLTTPGRRLHVHRSAVRALTLAVETEDESELAFADEKALVTSTGTGDDELELEPFDPTTETLADRIYALRDIVPPMTRARISRVATTASDYGRVGARYGAKTVWIGVTSALLLVLPALFALESEQMIAAQEQEYLAQQGGAAQMSGASALLPPGM